MSSLEDQFNKREADDYACDIKESVGEFIAYTQNLEQRIQQLKERIQELEADRAEIITMVCHCLLYTSPSPRDGLLSRMPSSA